MHRYTKSQNKLRNKCTKDIDNSNTNCIYIEILTDEQTGCEDNKANCILVE
jgi:hypothetical protein